MKKLFFILITLCLSFGGYAATTTHTTTYVVTTLTLGGVPTAGNSLTATSSGGNGTTVDSRIWQTSQTNIVFNQLLNQYTTNVITTGSNPIIGASAAASATNLFNTLSNYPVAGMESVAYGSSTAVLVTSAPGQNIVWTRVGTAVTISSVTNVSYWSTPGGTNDYYPMQGDSLMMLAFRTALSGAQLAYALGGGINLSAPNLTNLNASLTTATNLTSLTNVYNVGYVQGISNTITTHDDQMAAGVSNQLATVAVNTANLLTKTNSAYTTSNPLVVSNTAPAGTFTGSVNFPAGSTNNDGSLKVGGTVSVGITNNPVTDANVTNTVTTKGFPLGSIVSQFTVPAGAAATNGNAITGIIELDNVSPDTNSPTFFLTATYICNTNYVLSAGVGCTNVQICGHVFSANPTALGANGNILTTYQDDTNYIGNFAFTNGWMSLGTNGMSTTVDLKHIGKGTNWVLLVAQGTWTNNAGTPKDTMKFDSQKAY